MALIAIIDETAAAGGKVNV